MAHNYLVTAQQATVVSNSHCGYFNSSTELNTLLIKGNHIEIYTQTEDDGFQKIHELPIYGRIIQSLMFRPPKCSTDHLFLLTQSFDFSIIATDPLTNQIITKVSGTLKEENASIKTASQSLISVDQTNQNILIHIYKGEIVLVQLDEHGRLKPHCIAEKIIIHELDILSLTFLYSKRTNNTAMIDISESHSHSLSHSQSPNVSTDNAMNIDSINDNDKSELSSPLLSTEKSKKEKIKDKLSTTKTKMNAKLNKLKSSKINEKMKRLRRHRNSKESKEEMYENEEKKSDYKKRKICRTERLLLCVLYQDYRKSRHIKTYYLNRDVCEFEEGPWDTLMVEEGCNRLVSVPPPFYGVLFMGQYSIAYRNKDNCQRVQVPDGDLCCYDRMIEDRNYAYEVKSDSDYDPNATLDGTRWLIGDGLNRSLNVLILLHDERFVVKTLSFERLGEIVSPSSVSYICSGLCFIGSTVGDSQYIEIHKDKNWRQNEENEEDEDINMDISENKMNENSDEQCDFIEVLQEFTNLGPIVDLVSVDLERQGQCQLVTCSGVGRDGSLRVIKNGIGIEEVAEIEMEGIQGLWGLKENSDSAFDKYLITSFISETRVLAMTEEGLEEMEMNGLNAVLTTIHCSNMCNDTFVQIAESEINLIALSTMDLKCKWKCDEIMENIKINSCITNTRQLLCALSGGHLILLEVINNEIKCVHKTVLEHEIACVALSATFESINDNKSLFCAVGMWKDYSIRILSLPSFDVLLKFPLQTDIVPRSVIITNFNAKESYLFIGMGDGSLIEAKLDIKLARNNNNKTWNISELSLVKGHKKSIPLGTQPVRLVPFKCNDIHYIFGGCDRPTVIYLLNNRMFYANVNLPEIHYISGFNARDFEDCLAMSCEGNLMIGQMDEIQKLHITKVELNEQPRRISFNADTNTYLLATQCITNKPQSIMSLYNQSVYKLTLRDGQNIEDCLYTQQLQPYWNVTKIITHKFKCDPHVTYFIICSCLAKPSERSPTQGKVEVAMVTLNNDENETKLKICHSKLFRGDPTCVRGIGEDYLLIGVRSKIQLFRWMLKAHNPMNNDSLLSDDNTEEDYPFELHHLHTIHNNTFVLDIKVKGDFFIVIDLMKSISMFLLQYTGNKQDVSKLQMIDGTLKSSDSNAANDGNIAAIITEVARDYDPSWMKCGEMYNDQFLVGIDSFCNFFILKRNIDSLNEDERGRLDVVCRMHWGDDINVITHGSLVMDIPIDIENKESNNHKMEIESKESHESEEKEEHKSNMHTSAALLPTDLRKCVFGTIDGSIGVLISIPYARYDLLQKLEKSLRKFVQGIGGLVHKEWRKFKNQMDGRAAVGFLDGDLIETFLNLTSEQQQKIANDMKIDTELLTKIVEEMNRLH